MGDQSVSDDQVPKEGSTNRSACTECQRRKQKCNREWPCNNCHKRKVADRCRFSEAEASSAWAPSVEVKRKRERGSENEGNDWDDGEGLEAIGYTASHILASLEIGPTTPKTPGTEQYRLNPLQSPQLQRALEVLPERSVVDSLVQNFLDNVNFYYYIVYPPQFLKEYEQWWQDRLKGRSVGVQWTCLLIMVCACSVQHTDAELKKTLARDIKTPIKDLTNKYHDAARELHSVIPIGHNHMYTVQYLLHSCYWFKAEARFVECWHVLGSAVREAQMLGLHKESTTKLPQFEQEMRRRLWCIVDAWDWLVSALLARPMLIDRSDSAIGLPSLTLEEYPTSPLLHMKLQSDLVARIFKRFGPPKLFTDPADIQEYQVIIEAFMKTFPPSYAFENTDTSGEAKYPWIALHRHYMHTCTLSIALGPFRPFLAKNMSRASPPLDLTFRSNGVGYALRLMDAVHAFFEYVWVRDTTFHFVPFCIFDTAALLCSAILHDEDSSLPRRSEILASLDRALVTLKRLSTATDTAKTPLDILRRLLAKIRDVAPVQNYWLDASHKRSRLEDVPAQQQAAPAPPMSMPYAHVGAGIDANSYGAQSYGNQNYTEQSYEQNYGTNTNYDAQSYGAPSNRTNSYDATAYATNPSYSGSNVSTYNSGVSTYTTNSGGASILPQQQGGYDRPGASPSYSDGERSSGSRSVYTLTSADGSGSLTSPSHGSMPGTMAGPHEATGAWTYVMPPAQQQQQHQGDPLAQQQQMYGTVAPSMAAQMAQDTAGAMGYEAVPHDMGDLPEMWNWQSLDLGFGSNPMLQPQYQS